ncbi:HK97 family phage prohead protease [Tsuneonella sp. HG222]
MKTKQGVAVLELKALEQTGEFSGYGSVFGNVDSYKEVVMPGAFKRSLAEHRRNKTRPKMFWQHDPYSPIGSWTECAEDDHGLLVTGKLNMDVQKGAEAYALLKAGDIDGLSIGYRVVKSADDEEAGIVQLKELNLIEVSVVSLAANDQATVGAVKAAELEDSLARLAAGDRLQPREMEELFKEYLGFSNSEAERAVRCCLADAQGGPAESDPEIDFWTALATADVVDLTGEPD